jgi:D-amino-acid dehydrogenase
VRRDDILVIGGGVIGVCSAYYLASAGRHVTLVEKGEVCSGCSYGNVGLISPSHSIPLARAGVLAKALGWMLRPESPFYIRPRFDLELFTWLIRFAAACREHVVRKGVSVLHDLSLASLGLYQQLAAIPGLDFGFRRDGLLTVYISRRGYEEGLKEAQLLQEGGIEANVLSGVEVREREPSISDSVVGGIYFPQDAQLIPADFVRGLARECMRAGVEIRSSTEVLEFETSGQRISAVRTTRGDFWPEQVVLAGGAWSPSIIHGIQITLPIQAAKGYSITVKQHEYCPRSPLLFSEAKVFTTPMGNTLRFGGTLELVGLDMSVNRRRLDKVMRAARSHLSGVDGLELLEIWRGLRPCTPDGLPVVGRSHRIENLVVAAGHGMLGMTLGPITGKLVCQLVCRETPMLDVGGLGPDRFS